MAAPETSSRVSDDDLRSGLSECLATREGKLREQGGVPTFFDNVLKSFLDRAVDQSEIHPEDVWFLDFLQRKKMGRFVDYFDRKKISGSEIPLSVLARSQGVTQCLRWKGQLLFKSVFDFALYPMLIVERRPKTIIEIGSGQGGSALWLSDMAKIDGLDAHIYSLDVKTPSVIQEGVTFLQGDCRQIEVALPVEQMTKWPHPWVVIEDAHENVRGVLEHFNEHLESGDYLIVEDSPPKMNEISQFLSEKRNSYRVDTHYTDFFGHNATCSPDSIFRRF